MTPGEAGAPIVLCRLDEIEDGQGKGFVLGEGLDEWDLFVVREGKRVRGYVNSCPHTGTPLDWTPDRFMSEDGCHILCATHGALFEIDDGLCIAGPCAGDRLKPLAISIDEHGRVVLDQGPT